MAEPSVTLENGAKMPLMAFGTLMETLNVSIMKKYKGIYCNTAVVLFAHAIYVRIYTWLQSYIYTYHIYIHHYKYSTGIYAALLL